ncbi:MAG: type III-B CRISPR module RAMP protein Cmr6 [Planctomycetaceae bacterium]|nr:type III-B CRISPR module RAMP protein Cmr6 [Planctomycetaceae bacterium]
MPLDSRFIVPVPASVREHLDANTHPGLLLDKYTPAWSDVIAPEKLSGEVQRPTVDEVVRLSFETPPGLDWDGLQRRRRFVLDALRNTGRIVIRAKTASPLTLHLSRASSLENAGICLHRTFGFAYLPGTGMKGMTRAYAETVWLHAQPDPKKAWKQIEDVFGWAPNKLRQEQIDETAHPAAERFEKNGVEQKDEVTEHSGAIVFHDAWPETWPRLQADLLNNHHRAYYEGATKKGRHHDENPPGDWEEPNMVSFLAVAPGATFAFPVSKRRADVLPEVLDLAAQWLIGALTHSGAGAKTNAGYGDFVIEPAEELSEPLARGDQTWQAVQPKRRAEVSHVLELVTPAFLAGPHPDVPQFAARECDLRTATLRGLLRWWWRTMHAAWVDVATLRRLESALWGNTEQGGAVRIRVEPLGPVAPLPFDRRKITFDNKLPPPSNAKTTQGLTYNTYGMDESKGRRFMVPPETKWRVTLTARPAQLPVTDQEAKRKPLPDRIRLEDSTALLREAQNALWLLSQFGGVGSKSRKGFGSFAVPAELAARSPVDCQAAAKLFRQSCRLPNDPARPRDAESPSLEHLISEEPITTPWSNYWFALDRLGDAAQQFSQSYKHDRQKLALGLPRRIKNPFGDFEIGRRAADSDRHASPIMAHVHRAADGQYAVQLIAFPSVELPADKTAAKSREFLTQALQKIRANLEQQTELHATEGRTAAKTVPSVAPPASSVVAPPPPSVKPGDWVKAVLLAEKTGKGGWKAQHPGAKLSGPIQNSAEVPGDNVPGNELELVVAVYNGREIAFRYPTPADRDRRNKPPPMPTDKKKDGRRH